MVQTSPRSAYPRMSIEDLVEVLHKVRQELFERGWREADELRREIASEGFIWTSAHTEDKQAAEAARCGQCGSTGLVTDGYISKDSPLEDHGYRVLAACPECGHGTEY